VKRKIARISPAPLEDCGPYQLRACIGRSCGRYWKPLPSLRCLDFFWPEVFTFFVEGYFTMRIYTSRPGINRQYGG